MQNYGIHFLEILLEDFLSNISVKFTTLFHCRRTHLCIKVIKKEGAFKTRSLCMAYLNLKPSLLFVHKRFFSLLNRKEILSFHCNCPFKWYCISFENPREVEEVVLRHSIFLCIVGVPTLKKNSSD